MFVYERSWTCLHFVVYYEFPDRILKTMLLQTRSRELIDFRTFNQETALHLAARRGNKAGAVVLLQAGARVDLLDHMSRTPLLTALHCQNDAMVRLMVLAGASVNRTPGSTRPPPLHTVVARNNLLLTRLMLEHGSVVVDLRNDDLNWTVIHLACESGKWFFDVLFHISIRLTKLLIKR